MSTLTEIEDAIERLPPDQVQALAIWLRRKLESSQAEILAAVDDAERSLVEEGGVAVEDVRRDLHRWISK